MDAKKIKERAISGSKWSFIEKISLQVVQFIVGIVLARLLGPKAFGLIALTYIFITISGAITDGGFEKALIQNQDLSKIQINTAFYVNIVLGMFMCAIVCITAPFISRFFNAPELTRVLRVLSIGLPIDAFGQTQRMLLIKELSFKKISIGQICSAVVSGFIGITLAFYGFGVWALVWSSLGGTLTWVLIFWCRSHWYPKLMFSYASISKMVPFGLNVLASSILYFFLQQFNTFIVGKYYSRADLGLFNRGVKLPETISSVIQGVVLKTSFPLFAKLQNDEVQLKAALRKSNKIIAFISFPLLAFMFIDAREIVVFLLTDKWIGTVIFLKIFCLVNLLSPFISLQRELLLAKGNAKLLFKLFVISSFVEIIPILLLIKYQIVLVAWVTLISRSFQFLMYAFVTSRKTGIPVKENFSWVAPNCLIILVTVLFVQLVDFILPMPNGALFKLSLDFLIGGIFYFAAVSVVKIEELNTIKAILYSFWKKRAV